MLNSPLQSDYTKFFTEQAYILYDSVEQRIATIEEDDIHKERDFYHEILLFKEVGIVI